MISVLFGVFIAFFLIFFEPFAIDVSNGKYTTNSLLLFGGITAIVLLIYLVALPYLFQRIFHDRRWTVKHQLIYCLLILFTIATCNGLFTNYLNELDFSWANYWWIINRTFVLGAIPFAFLLLIDLRRREIKNQHAANTIRISHDEPTETRSTLSITTDLKDETFSFHEEDFLYAEAAGNYTDLYLTHTNESKRLTHRITLSSFEKQLAADYLVRCHRSFLVNLRKVAAVSGNAQGLKLTFDETSMAIPVSRNYITAIKSSLAKKPH